MKAQRPYLYKAIYDWIIDNGCTPYLLVDANAKGVLVPTSFVKDGKIVLNVSLIATDAYCLDEYGVTFSARFSGKSENLNIPFASMIALYAKENAEGMVFPFEECYQESIAPEGNLENLEEKESSPVVAKSKPTLKVIK